MWDTVFYKFTPPAGQVVDLPASQASEMTHIHCLSASVVHKKTCHLAKVHHKKFCARLTLLLVIIMNDLSPTSQRHAL